MKSYLDCIPCFLRQALDACRMVTNNEDFHESVLREVMALVREFDFTEPPPRMAQKTHRLIRRHLQDDDPYRGIKKDSNRLAVSLYPQLKQKIDDSPNPFETATRLAIAGNIIDFGAISNPNLALDYVHRSINESFSAPISVPTLESFRKAACDAENILYIGDNAGEIIFDRLLIEQIGPHKVTFVVRGKPVINDAVMADARDAKMNDFVNIVDNGTDIPGTILRDCSSEFIRCYERADLIIAKGQGNYETLNEEKKRTFFLLRVKCSVIAADLGCNVGSTIIKENRGDGTKA